MCGQWAHPYQANRAPLWQRQIFRQQVRGVWAGEDGRDGDNAAGAWEGDKLSLVWVGC